MRKIRRLRALGRDPLPRRPLPGLRGVFSGLEKQERVLSMAEQPLTFGETLSRWMKTHRLSSSSVAVLVGAKSATSVSRLRHDQCAPKRCEAFLNDLLAASAITPPEERAFRAALAVNRRAGRRLIGDEGFHRLLFPDAGAAEEGRIPDVSFLSEADEVELLCYQPVTAEICAWLQRLLARLGKRIRIRCVVPEPWPGDTLRFAVDALPLLCEARCSLAAAPVQAHSPTQLCVLRCRKGKRQREWLLAPLPGAKPRLLPMAKPCGLFDFMLSLEEAAAPINQIRPLETPESCMDFLREYYAKERGAEICLLQADLCMSMIPPEILQNAVDDAMPQPDFLEAMLALRRLAYLRFANQREKKKATHLLLSRQALRRFMDTGVSGDHFAMMRPFTPEERRTILRQLLEQAESNPALDLRLAREESIFGRYVFASFSGSGVLVSPAATDYVQTADAAPYCEAFLPDKAFARAFRDYFCGTLLPREAFSRAESIACLRRLAGVS